MYESKKIKKLINKENTFEINIVESTLYERFKSWIIDVFVFFGVFLFTNVLTLSLITFYEKNMVKVGTSDGMVNQLELMELTLNSTLIALVISLCIVSSVSYFKNGQTIGRKANNLVVLHVSGKKASKLLLFVRTLAKIPSIYLTFGSGILFALFTKENRAFHDLIARTVTRKIEEVDVDELIYVNNEMNYDDKTGKLIDPDLDKPSFPPLKK